MQKRSTVFRSELALWVGILTAVLFTLHGPEWLAGISDYRLVHLTLFWAYIVLILE